MRTDVGMATGEPGLREIEMARDINALLSALKSARDFQRAAADLSGFHQTFPMKAAEKAIQAEDARAHREAANSAQELLEIWGECERVRREPITFDEVVRRISLVRTPKSVEDLTDVVAIKLDSLIVADSDGFNTLISKALTGRDILMDIRYNLVGCDPSQDELFFHVEGKVNLEELRR